jgi:hypothetical protein
MSVTVVEGEKFDGVDYGSAPGGASGVTGYIIGNKQVPSLDLTTVDPKVEGHRWSLVGVKYFHHRRGDPKGDRRPPDTDTPARSLTMLVSHGRWLQRLWREGAEETLTVILEEPGDFIVWEPALWHSWYPLTDATMLTIRWIRPTL